MSFDALAWAAKQSPGSSAAKLVLLGLAECASRPDAFAFPSTAALVEFSSLDRKTVVKALDALETAGFITDSGKRMGQTGQIKVYRLMLTDEGSQKRDALKGSQFSHERLPKTGHGISKGTSTSGAKAPSVSRAIDVARSVDDQPDGFRSDSIEWARQNMGWSYTDAKIEFERFSDGARAAGRMYKDWRAAWRNWCRSPFCKTKSADDRTAYRKEPLRV